jgi:hypothetical protein
MDLNTPHLPYDSQRSRRGSSSFANRITKGSLRGIAASDWLQAASVVVAAAVIWIALYYTR